MTLSTNIGKSVDLRNEKRDYKQLKLKVKPLYDSEEFDVIAYSTDISNSGIGLIAAQSLPIGTLVAISLDENTIGEGEIVAFDEEWELWGWVGAERLGIRVINKSKAWPF